MVSGVSTKYIISAILITSTISTKYIIVRVLISLTIIVAIKVDVTVNMIVTNYYKHLEVEKIKSISSEYESKLMLLPDTQMIKRTSDESKWLSNLKLVIPDVASQYQIESYKIEIFY